MAVDGKTYVHRRGKWKGGEEPTRVSTVFTLGVEDERADARNDRIESLVLRDQIIWGER